MGAAQGAVWRAAGFPCTILHAARGSSRQQITGREQRRLVGGERQGEGQGEGHGQQDHVAPGQQGGGGQEAVSGQQALKELQEQPTPTVHQAPDTATELPATDAGPKLQEGGAGVGVGAEAEAAAADEAGPEARAEATEVATREAGAAANKATPEARAEAKRQHLKQGQHQMRQGLKQGQQKMRQRLKQGQQQQMRQHIEARAAAADEAGLEARAAAANEAAPEARAAAADEAMRPEADLPVEKGIELAGECSSMKASNDEFEPLIEDKFDSRSTQQGMRTSGFYSLLPVVNRQ